MSNVTNLNTYESVNQSFLVRQIINKNRACLSSGNTQIIYFERVLPQIVVSVRNSNNTFYAFSRRVVYDFFFSSCVTLFTKVMENVQLCSLLLY